VFTSTILVTKALQTLRQANLHARRVAHNDDLVVRTAGVVEGRVQAEDILLAGHRPSLLQVGVLIWSSIFIWNLALVASGGVGGGRRSLVAGIGAQLRCILSDVIREQTLRDLHQKLHPSFR